MRYQDGTLVALGHLVDLPVPSGSARGRVVMLGDTYEHLDIDPGFVSWVKTDKVLRPSAVVIEWLGESPFAHEDARYAPTGNYMFTDLDEWLAHAV
jgi:hypothetical protein